MRPRLAAALACLLCLVSCGRGRSAGEFEGRHIVNIAGSTSVMPFTEKLKELVLQGSSSAELKAEMIRQGIKSLRMSGLGKVNEGVTTIEEVCRVTAPDAVA